MSYFVVRVHTGEELAARESLTRSLREEEREMVETVHALVSFGEIDGSLDEREIRGYLRVKRLRERLNSLRFAYLNLDPEFEAELRKQYKVDMKRLQKEIKSDSARDKKMTSILQGYVIIQLRMKFARIPAAMYHRIKSARYVIGLPSRHPVPLPEVRRLFEKAAMEGGGRGGRREKYPNCEDKTTGGKRQKDQKAHPAGPEAVSPSYTRPDGMAGVVDMAAAKELEKEVDISPIRRFAELLDMGRSEG
ncbi:MAG TPA: hypothetical protein VEY51_10880 [Chondromyces sp.]|nr:hypothetical protein [Chondromyces sp.]